MPLTPAQALLKVGSMGKFQDRLKKLGDVPLPKRGTGRIAFAAVRQEVEEALLEGYTVKHIWSVLQQDKAMPLSYARFAEYVRRELTAKKAVEEPPVKRIEVSSSPSPTRRPSSVQEKYEERVARINEALEQGNT